MLYNCISSKSDCDSWDNQPLKIDNPVMLNYKQKISVSSSSMIRKLEIYYKRTSNLYGQCI